MPIKCPCTSNHANLEDANLKEESNNKFLNEKQIIEGITYSQCRND